ncbi:hypothetical protein GCM10010399_24240 [Dactylosporangium fulvum]|uniref:Uncharacterized protein n=1 Tax=Dactylosporangium fulvum TaxID=53359 RepID=A0ABY5W6A6_9ACTN|nr:hypothetical protein [Dactylosporangium fulvum]UWP85533.1 hypothetical protein Dfulv_15335 [Dactylosporangium fulvum]
MFVLETESIEWEPVVKNHRTGKISRKFIHEGEASPGVGYTSDLVRYEGGHGVFTAPRHRHNFDQFRFTISGEPDYGQGQVSSAGGVAFFPAGAHYGPERFEAAEILLVQWSEHWVTREKSDAAFTEMEKSGTFKEGYYVTADADGNEVRHDATNAIWEAVNGQPLVYPVPRYPQPVLMNPEGFAWRVDDGVRRKDLGHLTENDFNVQQYQWDADGLVPLPAERTQMVWLMSGEVEVENRKLGARTIVISDFGESHALVGVTPGEAMVFDFGAPLPGR